MNAFISSPKWRWNTSLVAALVLAVAAFVFTATAARPRLAVATAIEASAPHPRAPIYASGNFTFAAPKQMPKAPISPAFFQQDAEPEIKADLFGNTYVTAINGVPGG